jgi:hypothetical protein
MKRRTQAAALFGLANAIGGGVLVALLIDPGRFLVPGLAWLAGAVLLMVVAS